MASLANPKDERAADVRFEGDRLIVELRDGRSIATPIQWYPRLRNATPAERDNWVIDGAAWGIHWPDLDEDLSVEGMLDGRPAVGWDR